MLTDITEYYYYAHVDVICYRLLLIHVRLLVLYELRALREKSSGKKEKQERIKCVSYACNTHSITYMCMHLLHV